MYHSIQHSPFRSTMTPNFLLLKTKEVLPRLSQLPSNNRQHAFLKGATPAASDYLHHHLHQR
ncbi:hypothetical protein EMIT053CA3_200093 [Pseudomonas donghuensis]